MIIARRNLLRGLFAAPAIIAIDKLMPVKAMPKLFLPAPGIVQYNFEIATGFVSYFDATHGVWVKMIGEKSSDENTSTLAI